MKQCPLCYSALTSRSVTPCDICGPNPRELEELAKGYDEWHTFRELEVFGQRIVLCTYCELDFDSFKPEYFGLPRQTTRLSSNLKLIRIVDPGKDPLTDSYCEDCGYRMAFLKFLAAVRDQQT